MVVLKLFGILTFFYAFKRSLNFFFSFRTTDMNKILATQALELVGELVIGMGPQTRLQIPQLLPPVLAALADSKNTVRAAARATLNTMVKETSLKDMFVNEIVSTAVAKVGHLIVKKAVSNVSLMIVSTAVV